MALAITNTLRQRTLRQRLDVLAAAIFVAFFLPISAATAQEMDSGVFGEVIDVRVMNLEVVVTDKDGERVRGLAPEDFILTVDGAEVSVEYFTEIEGGTAVVRDDAGEISTVPALLPGEPVGTSFLVFLDDYFSLYHDRNRVLGRMIEQLPLLGPEDQMAVVAFDGTKLEMLANWTRSVSKLERVFTAAKERPAFGLREEVRRRAFSTPVGFDGRGTLGTRFQIDELATRLQRVTLAASTALRTFAQPSGRKAMLLLAGGWPDNPIDVVTSIPTLADYSDSLGYASSLYRPLFDTANRLSYTLYPVDVRGFRVDSGASAEYGDFGEAAVARELSSNREWSENATLSRLARETGGRAFLNSQNRAAFEGAWRDTRSYYWLGFTPEWRGEDERHKVRVAPRDPKLKVRSRRSFSDLSRQTEVTMMVESALLFGNPPGAMTLSAQAGESEKAGFRKVHLPVWVEIPVGELTFLPNADGVAAETELRVAVEDKNGDRSEIPIIPIRIELDENPEPGSSSVFETALLMRRMHHDLVVSLYDKTSGRMFWTRLAVDP